MTNYPPEPNSGDRISAQLIRDIIRCLRSITPKAGLGTRVSVTPNGSVISANPGRAIASEGGDRSCFCIGTNENGQLIIRNRYFQIGGSWNEVPYGSGADVYNHILQGELGEDQEYTEDDEPFVALVARAEFVVETSGSGETYPALKYYKTLEEMTAVCADLKYFVKPLYQLTHFGGIKVDFRNAPMLAMRES